MNRQIALSPADRHHPGATRTPSLLHRRWLALPLLLAALFGLGTLGTSASNLPASRQPYQPAQNHPALAVPNVMASMTYALVVDGGRSGIADPGDTLEYTVTISDSGADASGVTFTETAGTNTTYVANSAKASPVAVNDTYPQTVIGNVSINSANIPYSVTSNDYMGLNPTATITAFDAASAQGGQVSMTTTGPGIGQFAYNPPPGYEGADSFTYTLSNSVGSSTGTVSLTVSGMVWFINNNAAACTTLAGGCGRLSNPFSSLAAFQALNNGAGNNPAANDNIFIYESATSYTGPVTLLNGQRLIGQDSTSTLATLTGLTPPSGSSAFPPMNTGAPATTISASGNGVNLNGASGSNSLNGFTLGNCNPCLIGTSFGTLSVGNVIVNTTGEALSLTTGSLGTPSNYGGFTSITSTGGTNGVALALINGTANLGGGSLSGSTGDEFSVNGGAADINYAGTIDNTTVHQVNIASKTGGTVTLSGAVSGTGMGVNLTSNGGATINFTGGISLSTGGNTAFNATGGGTVSATQNNTSIVNTLTTTTGTALNVANTTIGASNLTYRSISSNGASSGIVLNATGSSGGLFIAGNGGTCTSSASCTGGGIQNATVGVSLTSTNNVSIDRLFIQNTADSGVKGTLVNNFSFTNGKVDSSGTGGGVDTSNIAFNNTGVGTEQNLTGAVTITGNTLTNAHYQGVDIFNYNGTISNLNISNNTLTSYTTTGGGGTTSVGSGIRVVAFGGPSTVANITKGTVDNNLINNFPGAVGINLQCGNANSPAAPSSTCGTPGNATNIISITNNQINKPGNGSTVKTGGEGIIALVNGVGQGNFDISGNDVEQNTGTSISSSAFGNANVKETITGNTVVSNNTVASQGIGLGTSTTGGFATNSPHLTTSIKTNNVSQTDGNGILAVARDSSNGKLDVTIKNNTVAAPLSGVRPGIRIDAGNATSVDDDVCLDISGNTSAGSGNPASTKQPGIGLRKQGTSSTTNAFGVVGMTSATSTPDVETFVNGQNPGSAPGGPTSGAVGGTILISATSGFSNCSTAPSSAVPVPSTNIAAAMRQEDTLTTNAARAQLKASATDNAQAASTLVNSANAFNTSFDSVKLFKQTAFVSPNDSTVAVTAENLQLQSALNLGSSGSSGTPPQPAPALAPLSDVSITIGTLPAGKSVTIKFRVTINNPWGGGNSVSNQGTVSGSNFSNVLTDDPAVGGTADPTVTPVPAPNDIYVDDNFPNPTPGQDPDGAGPATNFGFDSFASIQSGINAVPSGGTVHVADGSYTENVTMNQPATVVLTGSVTLNGDLTLSNGTWTSTSGVFNLSGHFTHSGGSFTHNGGTVVFNGTAAQTLGGTTATSFNHLTDANTSAALSVNTNTTVNGTLTVISSAILAPAAAVIGGGTGTLTGNGTIQVTRTAATADLNSQYTINTKALTNLSVNYNGAGDQTVNGLTYGALLISNTGIKTLGGSTTVNGDVTLNSAPTFAGGSNTLNVGGNWTNNGGTFTPGSGTVVFNGNNNTQTLSGSTTFNNLTINHTGTGGVDASGSTLSVTALLDVQAGTFTSASAYTDVQIDNAGTLAASAGTPTITVNGNWTDNHTSGSGFTPGTSTLVFAKSGTATLSLPNQAGGVETLCNLTVNGGTVLNTGDDAVSLTGGGCGAYSNNGQLTRSQTLTVNSNTTFNDSTNVSTVALSNLSVAFGSTSITTAAGGTFPFTNCVNPPANAVLRYWQITQSGGSGATATTQFSFRDSEVPNGVLVNTLQIYKCSTPPGGAWALVGSTSSYSYPPGPATGYSSVQADGVPFGSSFMLAPSSPTAVELSEFSAQAEGLHLWLLVGMGVGALGLAVLVRRGQRARKS